MAEIAILSLFNVQLESKYKRIKRYFLWQKNLGKAD